VRAAHGLPHKHICARNVEAKTVSFYDQAGNRTKAQTPSASTYYAWDAHSRLTAAEPVGGPVTYAYDGDGRRTRRQAPGQTRRFVYDFEKVLQDTDDSGLTQRQYASSEEEYGELLSAYGGGQARYFAPDGLGSTDALLAPDGSVPDRWAYRAFGLESHTLGSDDNRYTWVGGQGYYDDREAGLYFLRRRYCQGTPILTQLGDTNCYAGNRLLQTAWSPELASCPPSWGGHLPTTALPPATAARPRLPPALPAAVT
jgi:YD repeat-containing protein